MGLKLVRFGSVTLPDYDSEDGNDTDPTLEMLLPVLGGAFDLAGSDDGLRGALTLARRVLVYDEAAGALAATLDGLRALSGVREKLYAETADGSERWRYARLQQLAADRDNRAPNQLLVNIVFECAPGGWRGDAVDTTETMAGSPHTLTVANDGNRTVRDAVITITAGSSAITSVDAAVTGETDLEWSGTLAAGDSLVFDCGAKNIKNNGADDYANFSLGANHVIDDWLRLAPGNTSIDVTFSGGSTDSTVRIQFEEGWQ